MSDHFDAIAIGAGPFGGSRYAAVSELDDCFHVENRRPAPLIR